MVGGGGGGGDADAEASQRKKDENTMEITQTRKQVRQTHGACGRAIRDVQSDRVRGRCDETRKEEKEENQNAPRWQLTGIKISSSLFFAKML